MTKYMNIQYNTIKQIKKTLNLHGGKKIGRNFIYVMCVVKSHFDPFFFLI